MAFGGVVVFVSDMGVTRKLGRLIFGALWGTMKVYQVFMRCFTWRLSEKQEPSPMVGVRAILRL